MTTYRRMSHFAFSCDYHLVWPTKYRRKILNPGVQAYLLKTLGELRLLKTNTARELNQKFPHLRTVYWGTRSIWSAGYFVSTVSVNEEVIRRYIRNQGQEDAGQTNLRFG